MFFIFFYCYFSVRGLILALPNGADHGQALLTKISDSPIDKLTKRYKEGTLHSCRLTSYNWFDGLYQVSLQKSVLEAQFLHAKVCVGMPCPSFPKKKFPVVQDLLPGMLVKATVASIESFGVIVDVTERIHG